MSTRTIVILGNGTAAKIAKQRALETNHDAQIVTISETLVDNICLDMDSRVVIQRTPGGEKRIGFDSVIFCAGLNNKNVVIPGLSKEDVCTLHAVNDFPAEIKSIVIIGCGHDGIVASQKFKHAGFSVTVVEKAPRILPKFSFEASQRALEALRKMQINVLLQDEIIRGEKRSDGKLLLWTSKGKNLTADLVISTAGSMADTKLLEQAGAMIGENGVIFVDETMSTSLAGVYACGNGVAIIKAISHNRTYRPSDSMLERGAQVAATNAVNGIQNESEIMQPCAGLEIIQIADQHFGRTGLNYRELNQMYASKDFVRETLVMESSLLRLYAKSDTGDILGAEFVGNRETMAELNLISQCVVNHLKAGDVINLDVSATLREVAERVKATINRESTSISSEKIALWLAEQRKFEWLDVSETPSFVSRYFQANHVPLRDLTEKMRDFSLEIPLVITSASGRRAIQAYSVLKKRGFQQLFRLEGGSRTLEILLAETNANNSNTV